MAQGIKEFYQEAQTRGFQRDFQLRLIDWSVLNDTGDGEGNIMDEEDFVLLKTATLPQMETTINPAPFMGLEFNVPGTTKFPGSKAWNVEFYMTQSKNLRNIFIATLLNNFNFEDTSTGNMKLPGINSDTIQLALINDNMERITQYRLHGAFITSVGDVTFDLTASGAVQKIPVTIAYQYWTSFPDTGAV